MRRVIVESPLRGDRARNKRYARLCMLDCLRRGEAPFASHALYDHPDVLDDTIPAERELGMAAGFAWGDTADAVVAYTDLGISEGMRKGIERVLTFTVEYRGLPTDLMERFECGEDAVARSLAELAEAQEKLCEHIDPEDVGTSAAYELLRRAIVAAINAVWEFKR